MDYSQLQIVLRSILKNLQNEKYLQSTFLGTGSKPN